MRILHILDHSVPLHSGYSFRTLAILRQQRALGWRTSHVTSAKHGAAAQPEEEIDGLRFFRTAQHAASWAQLPLLRHAGVVAGLARRLHQVARATGAQILHAHSPALNALAAIHVGKALNLPVVYEIRAFWEDAAADHGTSPEGGLRYRLSRALENQAIRRADAVTTICEGLRADILARRIPGCRAVAGDKVTVIPNAVDADLFRALPPSNGVLAQRLNLGGRLVLGFIGSFYAYEGLALLIGALPAMLAAVPSLHLLLVGGGPEEPALRALVARLRLQGKVTLTGRVPHEQVAEYYQLIDVLVYPRLPMRLTHLVTPLKPLEAMAQGRLVVASDVGGHRELIEHGRTGMLFEAGSGAALAQQVIALLRQADSWPALRLRARHYVESQRNWGASVARYAPVYQRLLAARP